MRTFSRDDFYGLVWSKPMTHLARDFALSDVALHKVCRKHDIPTPPLGWWAKKNAGKAVKQTPLPRAKAGTPLQITIAAGEARQEPNLIATARDNARVAMSSVACDTDPLPNPLVSRTVAQLRKAKPSPANGLVAAEGAGLIKASVAPTSIDRLALALNRIAAATEALGIKLARGEKAVTFVCDGETIGFSVTEVVKREKHVMTAKELADEEAERRRQAKRRNTNSWDDFDFSFSRFHVPEWDYHPTGQLSFELEQSYLGGSPRRSFRDAKIQRLETMASDIAVGLAVLAAALKEDRIRRDNEARHREEERRQREITLRATHVEERRGAALDKILEEVSALERLRRLVSELRDERALKTDARVAAFLTFAEDRLLKRGAALSAEGLEERLTQDRLFGEDDDHGFRPNNYY